LVLEKYFNFMGDIPHAPSLRVSVRIGFEWLEWIEWLEGIEWIEWLEGLEGRT
jgi:hypothetical protein